MSDNRDPNIKNSQSVIVISKVNDATININQSSPMLGEQNVQHPEHTRQQSFFSIWESLSRFCDSFESRRNYILFSPDEISGSEVAISMLGRINWSMVFDFNPDSEETGLWFHSQTERTNTRQIIGINKEVLPSPGRLDFLTYWVYTNGLKGVCQPPNNKYEWKREYRPLLDSVFQTIQDQWNNKPFTLVLLTKNGTCLPGMYDLIDYFHMRFSQGLKVAVIGDKLSSEIKDQLDGLNWESFNLTANQLGDCIRISIDGKRPAVSGKFLVPAKSLDGENISLDIGPELAWYRSAGMEILTLDTMSEAKEEDGGQSHIEFYRGRQITWRELYHRKDVERNKTYEVEREIRQHLESTTKFHKIALCHLPGAGGTTMGRRLAYQIRLDYPTIFLERFVPGALSSRLISFSQKVQKPILLIVESHHMTVEELTRLKNDIDRERKHVVVLYIQRVFKSVNLSTYFDGVILPDEFDRFVEVFASQRPEKKNELRKLNKIDSKYRIPFYFGLITYERQFQALHNFIFESLQNLQSRTERDILAYLSLVYTYTQKSLNANLFASVLKIEPGTVDFSRNFSEDSIFFRLVVQDKNDELGYETEESFSNYWHPRHNLIAEELRNIILGQIEKVDDPDHGNLWKKNLFDWAIQFIKLVKLFDPGLSEESGSLLRALFTNRDNKDFLSHSDADWFISRKDKKIAQFSKLIEDIADKDQQYNVFKALTQAFPKEDPHFHGHFARFLYEIYRDYDLALQEAEVALEIAGEDYNLLHVKGMIYKRIVEDRLRLYEGQVFLPEIEKEIQNYTELACASFEESRRINPQNNYAYISEAQLIIKVMDFAKRNSYSGSYEDFFGDKRQSWYRDQMDRVRNIVKSAQFYAEQRIESMGDEPKDTYLHQCEVNLLRLVNNYDSALKRYSDLISSSTTNSAASFYRRMYIDTFMASQNKGERFEARDWSAVSPRDLETVLTFVEDNLRDDPRNEENARTWLEISRYSNMTVSLEEALAKVHQWYLNSESPRPVYYLYVLNAIKAIEMGPTLDKSLIDTVQSLLQEIKYENLNEKICFEWYSIGEGLKKMKGHKEIRKKIEHSERFERDLNKLQEVEGKILHIQSRQSGVIRLACGLDAFFVPSVGGFETRDTNMKVKFFVGFRYDGLQAWDVIKQDAQRKLI